MTATARLAIDAQGRASSWMPLLGALGVVYGDIGTSPLYALKETMKAAAGSGLSAEASTLGSVSLIIWAILLIVGVKYALLILRADNQGEGGIVAMLALLGARHAPQRSARALLLVVGLVGAALLYGDGAITPSISVLSAVEGLTLDAPGVTSYVVPITLAILVLLFAVQRFGTGFIGRIFGPAMLVWFVTIAILGLSGVWRAPEIVAALNPYHAFHFLITTKLSVAFGMLGAAFLAVTGGEAMYADMGHFGRGPIRAAWFILVMPALILNYLGQGGLLLHDASSAENPFFKLCPAWGHYPLVVFATLATVIASQAIISGAFSLTQQAMQLGFFPRMRLIHTSHHQAGQIYVPLVNWFLAAATLSAVLLFRSSDALAGAYGIAVSLLMVITTVLATLIALQWRFNPFLVLLVNGAFLLVDLTFFSANTVKLLQGGWFPLLLAGLVAFLMLTWRQGALLLEQSRVRLRTAEDVFLRHTASSHLPTIPGCGAFLSAADEGMPLPLMNFVHHLRVVPERILLITIQSVDTPRAGPDEKIQVVAISPTITRVILRFGFMERVHIPKAIGDARARGLLPNISFDELTYFISHETVVPADQQPRMARWRQVLFSFMHRNAEATAAFFCVPAGEVMEVGTEIEV